MESLLVPEKAGPAESFPVAKDTKAASEVEETKDCPGEIKEDKPIPLVTKKYIYGHQCTTEITTYHYAGKSALVKALEKVQLDDDTDWNKSPPWKNTGKAKSSKENDNDVVVFDQVKSNSSDIRKTQRRIPRSRRMSSTDSDSDSVDEVHTGRVRISCPHARRINFRERVVRLRSRHLRMQAVQDYSVFFD